VAGVSGAALSNNVLMIIGVATLFADAVSMSVSDYMSSTAEAEIEMRQRKEKQIEYDMDQNGLVEQMRSYFLSKGFTSDDANNLSNTIGRNREATVDLVISISNFDEGEDVSPMSSAVYTFLAFVFFGMVPLIADVTFITLMKSFTDPPLFLLTSIITACTLAMLGALKSVMAKSDPVQGALFMVVVGGIASFISWFIAYLLSEEQFVEGAPS
jgi:VIT1/CCC1 family predicted Fe2+/Mn2+ transporter